LDGSEAERSDILKTESEQRGSSSDRTLDEVRKLLAPMAGRGAPTGAINKEQRDFHTEDEVTESCRTGRHGISG